MTSSPGTVSTTSDQLPPGWQRHRVAAFDYAQIEGKRVPHVVGQVVVRHCGCRIEMGMRLDLHEQTSGIYPCELHGAQAREVLAVMKTIPPSEQEVGQMFAELLEAELAP